MASFLSPGGPPLLFTGGPGTKTRGSFVWLKEWAREKPFLPESGFYCSTSDVFKSRLERMARELDIIRTQGNKARSSLPQPARSETIPSTTTWETGGCPKPSFMTWVNASSCSRIVAWAFSPRFREQAIACDG